MDENRGTGKQDGPGRRTDGAVTGGLAAIVLLTLGMAALVWAYSRQPGVYVPIMIAAGVTAFVAVWTVARRKRRFYSPALWFALAGLTLAVSYTLGAAPNQELSDYYEQYGDRRWGAMWMAAVLASVAFISLLMLRRPPEQRPD